MAGRYGRVAGVAAGKDELVAVQQGESARIPSEAQVSTTEGEEPQAPIRVEDKATKPPARYTESTLLAAMEGAGKLIEDDELREAMAERGLGTPATRAATIEGLLRQKYIAREGRDLNVTGKGLRLIELCEEMQIEALTSPSMTGDWEAKLNKMQHGEISATPSCRKSRRSPRKSLTKPNPTWMQPSTASFPTWKQPAPNVAHRDSNKPTPPTSVAMWIATSRYPNTSPAANYAEAEAIRLFTEKELPEMDGFRSRFNKPFEAGLKLAQTVSKTGKLGKWKIDFVFEEELDPSEDLSDDQLIKTLTLKNGSTGKLYAMDKAYHLPELKTKDAPEGFRLGKAILQKELQPAEVENFTEGKTPLIDGFISKRTKRPFKAHLTLDFETGKIGFGSAAGQKAAKRQPRLESCSSQNPALVLEPTTFVPYTNHRIMKPETKPNRPFFSSGPCSKRPGWTLAALDEALVGRSHRAKPAKARIQEVIEKSASLLGLPEGYVCGIVPASDTGAVEMAMWSLLGARGVEMCAWESFGSGWVTDVVKQLKLENVTRHEADYGQLPDFSKVNFSNDVVFTYNGTTSGVKVPNLDWIPADREGLTICDATVFAMDIDYSKLDVVTWSWQKVMGGEGAHGMIVLSPRAIERLESYTPAWPLPKIFRMTKGGKLIKGIFSGATINTILALHRRRCRRPALGRAWRPARPDPAFASQPPAIADWVAKTDWIDFLAEDPATISNTDLPQNHRRLVPTPLGRRPAAKAKQLVSLLDQEVGYDFGSYRDAPAGLRIWGGATVDTADIQALLPWLDWAFEQIKD